MSAQALPIAAIHASAPQDAELPPLPAPNVAGGGEVLIEAIVDRRGALTRPVILRATPPYTQLVLDAIAPWQFEPAREIDYKGVETHGRDAGPDRCHLSAADPDERADHRRASEGLVQAVGRRRRIRPRRTCRIYPPQARDGGVVLYESCAQRSGPCHRNPRRRIDRRI